jgi:hypothetical protein
MKPNKTLFALFLSFLCLHVAAEEDGKSLRKSFLSPPDASRPGVYWYFMDGNLSAKAITADLESMKQAGIGHVLFLEVNVGVPRGNVDFLSEEWQELFAHAVKETERLGIEFTLGSGPGWAGSGGPWVKPEQSMRHLVASETIVQGGRAYGEILPTPAARKPFFGEGSLTPRLKEIRDNHYEDVCVLAFPTPSGDGKIKDVDEKALYYRAPYTSMSGVKPYLPSSARWQDASAGIDPGQIIDLTGLMDKNGRLTWDVPAGEWTVMRFGLRNNGAVTRPAPVPGLGFEVDKMDTTAFNAHFDAYMGKLLDKTAPRKPGSRAGWTMIHIDSWEMGAQNWTNGFREEFKKRRLYDPLKYLPTYTGKVVGNTEISERFLWDVRQTAMELVLENHAVHFKNLGRRHGMTLSIEPYDMNPTADLDLGAVADLPMCEFWTAGRGFNSAFSCFESTSIAHVYGRPVVGAEALTAHHMEAWQMYPGNVKEQGDWAFCMGINKFVYHTFAHKALDDKLRPGMTMGKYGVHWDRGQTWWPLSSAYHLYVTRCQHVLRQGQMIADVLYLTPEGAPHVFTAPGSAVSGNNLLPDKRGYNFDGCSPKALVERADVEGNRIVFPGGSSYSLLVLPHVETMTPGLLEKIDALIRKGARVIGGNPPEKSPGMTNYPECDVRVRELAGRIWGARPDGKETEIRHGEGTLYTGGKYAVTENKGLYPVYDVIAAALDGLNIREDFVSGSGLIRYAHRSAGDMEIYFIANKADSILNDMCTFRTDAGSPELWDPLTGETFRVKDYTVADGRTSIPVTLDRFQSFFIVFDRNNRQTGKLPAADFTGARELKDLSHDWDVSFDTNWGGPGTVRFETLVDWTKHADDGIRYYSGTAVYRKTFDLPPGTEKMELFLDLGDVKNLARVKLNGRDLGIVWTSPWRVGIDRAVKSKGNTLEIELVNLWPNRLIGDERLPDDEITDGKWPEWLLNNTPRTSGRYTFTTHRYYKSDSPLLESGLIGPVSITGRER